MNPLSCLGCCEFFYSNCNIYCPYTSSTPLLLMGEATNMKNQAALIKDSICYLLNNGGGVMLFDCEQKYRDVYPVGEFVSTQEKDAWNSAF